MASNRGVVYLGSGKVEIQSIDYPKLQNPKGKKIDHGVILKIVTTNICGSDQHMVRGRTTAQPGFVLGHEGVGPGRVVQDIGIGCPLGRSVRLPNRIDGERRLHRVDGPGQRRGHVLVEQERNLAHVA